MPFSYNVLDNYIRTYIYKFFKESTKILDVGPGAGKYHDMLSSKYSNLDCIEVWRPYIGQYSLLSKYKIVYNDSIMNRLDLIEKYDLIILGDVLEHLSYEDSKKLIEVIIENKKEAIILIPFECPQGTYEGNSYEIHKQDNLNFEFMEKNYPELELIISSDKNLYVYAMYKIKNKI